MQQRRVAATIRRKVLPWRADGALMGWEAGTPHGILHIGCLRLNPVLDLALIDGLLTEPQCSRSQLAERGSGALASQQIADQGTSERLRSGITSDAVWKEISRVTSSDALHHQKRREAPTLLVGLDTRERSAQFARAFRGALYIVSDIHRPEMARRNVTTALTGSVLGGNAPQFFDTIISDAVSPLCPRSSGPGAQDIVFAGSRNTYALSTEVLLQGRAETRVHHPATASISVGLSFLEPRGTAIVRAFHHPSHVPWSRCAHDEAALSSLVRDLRYKFAEVELYADDHGVIVVGRSYLPDASPLEAYNLRDDFPGLYPKGVKRPKSWNPRTAAPLGGSQGFFRALQPKFSAAPRPDEAKMRWQEVHQHSESIRMKSERFDEMVSNILDTFEKD